MKCDYVFTFVVPELPFSDTKEKIIKGLQLNGIKAVLLECNKGFRLITVGSSRRKVERLMWDLNGRHLRSLDSFTFEILSGFIRSDIDTSIYT